jgi:hypothetical protein
VGSPAVHPESQTGGNSIPAPDRPPVLTVS